MPVSAMLQVYYFSRGKVKPANRNFSTVRNDYTINLDNGCALPAYCRRTFAALMCCLLTKLRYVKMILVKPQGKIIALLGKSQCLASPFLRT